MSRRYFEAEKNYALNHLAMNEGNVAQTAAETGIPVRTLYRWQKQRSLPQADSLWHENLPQGPRGSHVLPQQNSMRQWHNTDDEEGEYTQLRRILMQHIFRLSHDLSNDPDTAHLRAIALARLLDRVIKLQTLTRFEKSVQITLRAIPPRGEPGFEEWEQEYKQQQAREAAWDD